MNKLTAIKMRKLVLLGICLTVPLLLLIEANEQKQLGLALPPNGKTKRVRKSLAVSRRKTMTIHWSFADPPNTAVITTTRIVSKNYAVLRVVHQEGWQFLDGEEVTMRDAIVVGLQELLQKDSSLGLLADLPKAGKPGEKRMTLLGNEVPYKFSVVE